MQHGTQGTDSKKATALHKQRCLQDEVQLTTPPNARILVVGKGDNALLDLHERRAEHFPPSDDGIALGHPPANCMDAIAELDRLRHEGAEYLLFPEEAFWWFQNYPNFRRHLESIGYLVQRNNVCAIYYLRRLHLTRPATPARVIALLATYNEERFIGNCLRNLIAQGVQVQIIDNESTDRTLAIAQQFLGKGLLGIDRLPRDGIYRLPQLLRRKEEWVKRLDADWFIHMDPDEVRLPPFPDWTLAEAFAAVTIAGYNAVNFQEFTFVPTAEAPDHEHGDYENTMRSYYPFLPSAPWRVTAWRRQEGGQDLVTSGGHKVRFPGLRLCPYDFPMRHYQFLSVRHSREKYGSRRHDEDALRAGLHGGFAGWRHQFPVAEFRLPQRAELRDYHGDSHLDASEPWTTHFLQSVSRPAGEANPSRPTVN